MANIALENLTYTYPEAQAPTLNQIQFTFKAHQFTLLTGPSGTGKSTLLKLMTGLLKLTEGSIRYDEQPLTAIAATERAGKVALMFQNPNQQFAMDTVENELIFALENRQVPADKIQAKLTAALAFVGISDLRKRNLNHLSGGEKQKVALAVIVAMDSDVILLDEPFASVDPAARASLLKRLVQLRDQAGKTIILADHDLTDYETLVDQVVRITPDRQLTAVPHADWSALFAAFARTEQTDQHWELPKQPTEPLFQLQQVALTQGRHRLLQPTDLTLLRHRNTLITGPNGSGKSTLFESLVRLTDYDGQISYLTNDIKTLRRKRYARQVALLFQDAETQFLNITVAEELAQSQKYAYGDYFTPDRITAAMQQLNLTGHEDQVIYTLSEGQKKKLQIVLMLIMQSPVLLMDEPLKGLDLASVQALVALLKSTIAVTHQSLIIISHQLTGLTPLIDYHLRFEQQHLQYREAL